MIDEAKTDHIVINFALTLIKDKESKGAPLENILIIFHQLTTIIIIKLSLITNLFAHWAASLRQKGFGISSYGKKMRVKY